MIRWRSGGLLLPLSVVGCGALAPTPSIDADAGVEQETGPRATEASDAAPPETTESGPSSGVVWVRGEASSFDPHACSEPASSDLLALSRYVHAEMSRAGLTGAAINAGGGVCAFGTSPTTMSESDVFTGTPAAAQAFKATMLAAPFRGTYVVVPIVVKTVRNVRFRFFIGDGATRAFDDVWVHDGLGFDLEAAFLNDVCNTKASFDAALATSAVGATVKAWLGGQSVGSTYRLGYDAVFSFDDGTTTKLAQAYEATGGPGHAPCPNLVASP